MQQLVVSGQSDSGSRISLNSDTSKQPENKLGRKCISSKFELRDICLMVQFCHCKAEKNPASVAPPDQTSLSMFEMDQGKQLVVSGLFGMNDFETRGEKEHVKTNMKFIYFFSPKTVSWLITH